MKQTEQVYMYVGGRRYHYQVAGEKDAPPLVLLHGIGGSVNWWQNNISFFGEHFQTFALDLPGFGQSWRLRGIPSIEALAQNVLNWLDFMELDQVCLVGHSMGGQIAIHLAAKYPHRIKKLVLVAPSGLRFGARERLQWAINIPKVWVPLKQTLTIATGTLRTDLVTLGLSLQAILNDHQSVPTALARLNVPTLLLWGEADGVVPPALGLRMLELIPSGVARLQYVARGTHNVMYDQAVVFNQAVLDFLATERNL